MDSVEKCIICGKNIFEKYRPFCSTHCRDVDLGKWLNESYYISTKGDLTDELSNNTKSDLGGKNIRTKNL